MTSKIEFYREVLAIEPSSRVFFPLAKALGEQGNLREAVTVLRSGMGHNPDHLEAKFLLMELYVGLGQDEQAAAVFSEISGILSHYPSMWSMWANKATGLSKDSSLALRFLSASFKDPGLSWAEVMEKGLKAPGEGRMVQAPPAGGEKTSGFHLRGADEVMALARNIEAPETLPSKECAADQAATVKTRTMAELLVKHGDYASALEIYQDLCRLTDPAGRSELLARVEEIHGLMAGVKPQAAEAVTVTEAEEKPKSKAKLLSMLEALANRLDARVTA
jgi:tetratricopeptide (TPR) repeat protein